jgi:hypothetical protein
LVLITEGNFGRFFEVTTEGEIVWEYVNPYFASRKSDNTPALAQGENNAVFRAFRYAAEEIPWLGK